MIYLLCAPLACFFFLIYLGLFLFATLATATTACIKISPAGAVRMCAATPSFLVGRGWLFLFTRCFAILGLLPPTTFYIKEIMINRGSIRYNFNPLLATASSDLARVDDAFSCISPSKRAKSLSSLRICLSTSSYVCMAS